MPYNISFIDQACSVKMDGYWPRSFLRVYGPRRAQWNILEIFAFSISKEVYLNEANSDS